LIGLRKQDVQKDWAKAALADKENGGHWTSLVTRIKSFALENTNERSFTNKTYGSLESECCSCCGLGGRQVLWREGLLARTNMTVCVY
jgi:hypothetical protein